MKALDRLRALEISEKAPDHELTKLPKPPFVSFGSAGVAPFANILQAADDAPRYRWLILEPDGQRREVCCAPEMTRSELAGCYPGSRLVQPLPDSAAEAAAVLGGAIMEPAT